MTGENDNDGIEQLRDTFREEALELLSGLDTSLVELEKRPGDREIISSIFRAFHTLKGSGGMCGFDEMSRFTHQIETVYNLVRNGRLSAEKTLIDLTLASCDLIRGMIERPQSGRKSDDRGEGILSAFTNLIEETADAETEAGADNPSGKDTTPQGVPGKQITYRIGFRPARDILSRGINPLTLLNELRRMGRAEVIARTDEIPELHGMDPEKCYTHWDVILTTGLGIDAIKDVFIFVEDESDLEIDTIHDGESPLGPEECRKLGDILAEKKELSKGHIEKVLQERKRIGEILADKGSVEPIKAESVLREQKQARQMGESRQKGESMMNIRVSSKKLDKLVNLVGELVTLQSRLSQASAHRNDPELLSIVEEVDRLTRELRDNTMEIRMMPIHTIFNTFNRLVRDLAKELGKEVELITEGGETELDKTVIEKLNDPLVHLIRNSIDHGIEMPEVRKAQGKARKGIVYLSATHCGDHVAIRIMDDGAGLDKEKVRAKAVGKGLVAPDAELTERDIYSLIFAPGFTTSDNVTAVSGRGVGLDVVKKSVDALGGSIEISSQKGSGTTISLNLPLTLAIIEGLMVKIDSEYFILPLLLVEECVELTLRDQGKTSGMQLVEVRGRMVPYIRLREKLRIVESASTAQQIVIVNVNGSRVGLAVDQVIGGHQTVIKNLGKIFHDVDAISGATILGDGTVALILDVPKLIELSEREEVITASAKCAY